jgi:hypothetical protein
MPKEKKKEPKPYVDRNLRATRLAALLDFYSDRATAHASLFVASLFGLFSVLSIVDQLTGDYIWFSMVIYFLLAYSGYFTLVRFGFYAQIAHLITLGLEEKSTFESVKFSTEKGKTNLDKKINSNIELKKFREAIS